MGPALKTAEETIFVTCGAHAGTSYGTYTCLLGIASDLVVLFWSPALFHAVSHDCSEQAGVAADVRLNLHVALVERQVEPPNMFANRRSSRNPARDRFHDSAATHSKFWRW